MNHRLFVRSSLLSVIAALGGLSSASAQTSTYVGPDNGSWYDAGNWSPSGVPMPETVDIVEIRNSNTVLVNATGGGSSAHINVGSVGDGTLIVGSGGGLGTYTLSAGANTGTGTVLVEAGGVIDAQDGQIGVNGIGTITVTGAGSKISMSRLGNSIIIGTSFAGNGSLIVEDSGEFVAVSKLIFADSPSTSVGRLELTSGGVLVAPQLVEGEGSATIDIDGGILRANANEADFLSGFEASDITIGDGGVTVDTNGFNIGFGSSLNGSGMLTKTGEGTLSINALNFASGVIVEQGTLLQGRDGALVENSNVVVNGGTLDLNDIDYGTSDLRGTGGTVDLGSATLSVTGGGSTSYAGNIIGTGGLSLIAGSDLELKGNNTYAGATQVGSSSTLTLSSNTALTAGTALTVDAGGLVRLDATPARAILVGSLAGSGNVDATTLFQYFVFGADNTDTTFSGRMRVAAGGAAGKRGTGTTTFTGSSNDLSSLIVSEGTFKLGAGARIGNASVSLIANEGTTATFDVNGNSVSINTLNGNEQGRVLLGNGGSLTLAYTNNSIVTYFGTIAGDGELIKIGGGELTLTGANSYTGGTTIESGILRISADNNLGAASGGLTFGDATLKTTATLTTSRGTSVDTNVDFDIAASTTLTHDGVIVGNGSVTKLGLGTLILGGVNTYQGGTFLNGGVTSISADANLGNAAGAVTFDGGTLRITGHFANSRDVSILAGGGTIDVATSQIATFEGQISGTGTLRKSGDGWLYLEGDNSAFSGDVNLMGGGVFLTNANAIGSGALTLSGYSTLLIDGDFEVANAISIIEAGSLTGYNPGSNGIFSGAITLDEAFLTLATNASSDASITVRGGITGTGDVSFSVDDGASLIVETGALNNTGRLFNTDNGEGSVTIKSVIGANVTGLTQGSSLGSLVLEGANTYLGETRILRGVLSLVGAGSIASSSGVSVGATGTFDISGLTADQTTIKDLSGSGTVDLGAKSLAFGTGNDTAFSGAIDGTVPAGALPSLLKQGSGTVTLSGTSSYTGGTVVGAGRLVVDGSLGNTAVSVSSGAELSGSGSIGGTVAVDDGGILFPGSSPGTLTLGGLDLSSASILSFELGNPDSDLIDVTGLLNLDGILQADAYVGFGAGTYKLFNYGSLSNDGLTFGKMPLPFEYQIDLTTDGEVNLIVTAAEWQYWDGSQTTPNDVVDGGPGTWDAATTNWTSSTGNANGPWDGTVGAVFKGAPGTVTIADGATITAPALSFQTEGYILTAAGSGNLQLSGDGVVEVLGGATATINAPITSGQLTKTLAGTLVLGGANTYLGDTNIEGGTLRAGATNTLSSSSNVIVANGATLDLNDFSQDIKSLTGAGTVQLGSATLKTGSAADTDFTGSISGSGGITKQGNGKFTLSGSNDYSGITRASNGVLAAGAENAFSANSALIIGSNGEVRLGGFDQVIASLAGSGVLKLNGGALLTTGGNNSDTTHSGQITGNGKLFKIGTGTMTLSGPADYTGSTIVSGGGLKAGGHNVFSAASAYQIDSGAELLLDGTEQTIASLAGAGDVRLGSGGKLTAGNDANTIFSGILRGNGQLTKVGSGRLELAGANTYSGGTVLNEGTLRTNHEFALGRGAVTINSGTLRVIAPLSIESLTWNGGRISLEAGNGITLDHALVMTVEGDIRVTGALANTQYELLSFETLGSTVLALNVNKLSGDLDATITLVDDAGRTKVMMEYVGKSSGSTLSNTAPDYTPTNADFVVRGGVVTSDQVNTVGTLTFDPQSILIVFNQLIVSSGNLIVGSGAATLDGAGMLVAPDGLTKLGEGLLNVLNDILVNGNASITAGQLAVNGSMTVNDLFVQAGAWLKGNGVIFGNVINRGTVAPGNSPGTLTITGNFTQTSSGTLQEEIASLTNFDRLIVGGTANLGGTLAVVPFGGFELEFGQQFQGIVQAGEINGTFDRITAPDGFRGRVLEDGGILTLVIAPESYTQVAQNQNQKNVAKALNIFIGATGDRDVVSTALDLQTAEQYPAAFEAIMPGFFSSLPQISLEQITAQNQFIAQRLSAVRLGVAGFNAQGINMSLANDRDGKSVMDAKDAKTVITPANATKWALWVQGNGIFGRMSLTNLPTNRFASGGFLGGADYRWSENFSTGIYSGYQGTFSKYSNSSSTTINSTLFGLYATYQQGGFYSDAIVGAAYNNYSNRRAIEFSTIDRTGRSDVGGGQLTAYLDAGYDWQVGKFTFGPLASLQYTYTGLGGFTESGADSLDLAMGQYNANSIRTNLGGRIAYTWNVTDNIVITPEVRMFWQHEYLNDQQSMSASLDGGAGPGFDYQPAAIGQDSVFAGTGVSAQFGPNWNAYVYYNADFGRQDYVGQMISGGLNWKF